MFRQLFQATRSNSRPSASRPASFQPKLEDLESRLCPAVIVWRVGANVYVSGDNANDAVAIEQDDASNTFSVAFNGPAGERTFDFPSNRVRNVFVNLRGGNDELKYTLLSDFTIARSLYASLGDGADDVRINEPGSEGELFDLTNSLSFNIDGGAGNDEATLDLGNVDRGSVSFRAALGDGDDRADLVLDGPIAAFAHVSLDLQGGAGADNLRAVANNGVASRASLSMQLDGGLGNDAVFAECACNDPLNGAVAITANGGLGNDDVTANVTTEAESRGVITAYVLGSNGNDRLFLGYVNRATRLAYRSLRVDGGAGFDTATASQGVLRSNIERIG